MSEKEKKEEKAGEAQAAPKKKGGKLLFILLPIVGAIAGIGVSMAIPRTNDHANQKPHEPEEQLLDFAIPEIRANLQRAGGLHFIGCDIQIKIKSRHMDHVAPRLGLKAPTGEGGGHGGGGGKPAELSTLGPDYSVAARDRIILLFNAKTIDDLEGREKKELLKKEIKAELDEVLFPEKDGEVEAVLFRTILIQ
ncbi:MAG: flagellar basal body-associated FliL family protein [Spirochaetia bacterium]|nr:flagellar basal body-associated FliL family protein [Spirochaetia bacterium]